jgi:hypothetical protein
VAENTVNGLTEEKTEETDIQVLENILVVLRGIEVTITGLKEEITDMKSEIKDVKSESLHRSLLDAGRRPKRKRLVF